jgi:alkylation response protein AidB-like acyl-CoA dehydrogenase
MDFSLDEQSEAFRLEVRAFLEEQITDELEERLYRTGVLHDDDSIAALCERGWYAFGAPENGCALDQWKAAVLHEELMRYSAPIYAHGTTALVPANGRTVRERRLARRHPAQGVRSRRICAFDLPGADGSTGNRDPDVNTVSGERTNVTYYDDVRVEDRYRIGDVDGGWGVMTASLQSEHSAGWGTALTPLLGDTEEWAVESGSITEPEVRERLARVATDVEVSLLLQRRATWMAEHGRIPIAEGPMAKLCGTEALVHRSQDCCALLGPDGLRSYLEPTAPRGGRIEHAQRFALGTTVYAGTSEIQRNIIAGFALGLPR